MCICLFKGHYLSMKATGVSGLTSRSHVSFNPTSFSDSLPHQASFSQKLRRTVPQHQLGEAGIFPSSNAYQLAQEQRNSFSHQFRIGGELFNLAIIYFY